MPTFLLQVFISLVFLDDLHGSLGVIEWEQNLVQPGVTLVLQSYTHRLALTNGTVSETYDIIFPQVLDFFLLDVEGEEGVFKLKTHGTRKQHCHFFFLNWDKTWGEHAGVKRLKGKVFILEGNSEHC